MTKLEQIEAAIASLDPEDVAKLTDWLSEFHARQWDQRFEADVASGGLDALADKVLADHKAGKTTPL
jgi:hypothetical protein